MAATARGFSSFVVDPSELQLWEAGVKIVQITKGVDMQPVENANATPQPSLKNMIAFEIGAVPEVEAVFVQVQDRVYHVWTVIRDGSREARRAVYAREKVIIDRNDYLDFDFNVVNDHGADPRSMFTDENLELAFIRE
jgi:hypothetical protein